MPALHPVDEADLRWRWTLAEGEMGLRSSFPGFVAQCQVGAGRSSLKPVEEIDSRCVEAASRARLIDRVLELIPRDDVLRLHRVFHGRLDDLEQQWGPAAALLLESPALVELHRKSRSQRPLREWLLRLGRRATGEPPVMVAKAFDLRMRLEAELTASCERYAAASREVRQRRGRGHGGREKAG